MISIKPTNMKRIQNIFILLFALSLSFVACEDPFANDDFAAYTEQPIGIYLKSKPQYANWVKLLEKADTYNALNVNNDFTCFAANNAAVTRYIQTIGFTSIDSLTEDEAKNIVEYHIVPNSIHSYNGLGGAIPDKTASGDFLLVDVLAAGIKKIDDVQIINPNQEVINGVIHELEDVLQPPLYTVGELLEQSENCSIFSEAVALCGIDTYLKLKETYVDDVPVRNYKTLLVVPDSVFIKKGILSVDDLNKKFKGNPKDYRSDFYMFVAYHVLTERYDNAALQTVEFQTEGKNYYTYAKNQFITITDNGVNIVINAHDGGGGVLLDTANINMTCNNGYIHEINELMEVTPPVAYRVQHEFTYGKEFEALEIYRVPANTDNTDKSYTFKEKELDYITWNTIPSGMGYIRYIIFEYLSFTYADWLYVYLESQIGTINFTIPTLVPGSYEVFIYKWSYNGLQGSNPVGSCQTYFNGEKLGPEMPHTGGDHKFRAGKINITELKDSNTISFKQVKTGGLGFDRVEFIPIKLDK